MTDRAVAYATLKKALFDGLADLEEVARVMRAFAQGLSAAGEHEIADDIASVARAIAQAEDESESEHDVEDWLDVAIVLDDDGRHGLDVVGQLIAAMAACLETLGRPCAPDVRLLAAKIAESPRARPEAAQRERLESLAQEADEMIASGFVKPNRWGTHKIGPAEWAAWDRRKASLRGPQPDDSLAAMPPPPSPPEPLTAAELRRVLELARVGSQALGRDAEAARRALALFAAELLPRFKAAARAGHPSVPIHLRAWLGAAQLASEPREFSWVRLFTALDIFEEATPPGTFAAKGFPATWRLKEGAFVFDTVSPATHLHRRTRGKKPGDLQARWALLQAAAGPSAEPVVKDSPPAPSTPRAP